MYNCPSQNLLRGNPDIIIADEMLSNFKENYIRRFLENNEKAILVKENKITLTNRGELEAYELRFLFGDSREIYWITVLTISGDYYHRIYFVTLPPKTATS